MISLFILFTSFRDARREDIVTLVFQIWLLSLAIITVSRLGEHKCLYNI